MDKDELQQLLVKLNLGLHVSSFCTTKSQSPPLEMATNSIPVGANLLTRNISNGICQICHTYIETWNHCFFNCTWIKEFWANSFELLPSPHPKTGSFLDLCHLLLTKQSMNTEILFTVLWFIWLERNNFIFRAQPPKSRFITDLAHSFLSEYQKSLEANNPSRQISPIPTIWTKPKPGTIKTNVDAGYRRGVGSAGIVIRSEDGKLLGALSLNLGVVSSAEEAESLAILHGILESARVWSGEITIESDSFNSIAKIQSAEDDLSPIGDIIKRAISASRMFSICNFKFVNQV